ncbi:MULTISPECIES: carbon storage regulator [unclassified Schlesneria]|uniref:carbon storage regulator n=1 Tax=Schlesneria TaxID=656899 RepID=UPI002F10F77E
MLVLSRKSGGEITIAGGIKITVLKISGNRVRLGVDAPPEMSIRRDHCDQPGAPACVENKQS